MRSSWSESDAYDGSSLGVWIRYRRKRFTLQRTTAERDAGDVTLLNEDGFNYTLEVEQEVMWRADKAPTRAWATFRFYLVCEWDGVTREAGHSSSQFVDVVVDEGKADTRKKGWMK